MAADWADEPLPARVMEAPFEAAADDEVVVVPSLAAQPVNAKAVAAIRLANVVIFTVIALRVIVERSLTQNATRPG